MTDIEALEKQLKRHEGLRLKPYRDTLGYWTCGYGHLLTGIYDQRTIDTWRETGISKYEADAWLRDDIDNAIVMARYRYLKPEQFDALSPTRQQVLVNMAFNLGNKLLKFKHLRQAVLDEDWYSARDHMLNSKWAEQVKGRAVELAEMMLHDIS